MAAKYLATPAVFQGPVQNLSTSTTAAGSANFGSATQEIMLVATVATYVLIGNSVTATTSNGTLLPPNFPVVFKCNPGQMVSAILSTGTGSLNITELT